MRDCVRFGRGRAVRALAWTLFFLLALALTYWRVLSAGPSQFSGRYDVYRYFTPNAFFLDTAIHSGEFPLWNPLVYCGIPFAANPQVSAFYPPNVARALLNVRPTPQSTQLSIVILMALHMLLAAAGAYRLARAHGAGRPGAYAAAVAFTFSALMVRRVCEYHFIYTLNWLPWVLLFVKRAIDAPVLKRKLANGAAAGFLFGLAVLGGFLQIVPHMALAAAAYAVSWRLLNWRQISRRAAFGDVAAAAVTAAVAAGIAAVLLVPAAELATFAARQPEAEIDQYSHLAEGGIPVFLQNLVAYAGIKYEAEAVRGSGAAALMLALAGILLQRRKDALAFLVPWLVLVDCSFGPPMPIASLMERLTPFATSATTRAFDVALLPMSLLVAFGVDAVACAHAAARAPKSRLNAAVREALTVALAAAVLAGLFWIFRLTRPFLNVYPYALVPPGLALAILVVAPWLAHRKNPAAALQAALPLLIFLETLAWNHQYVPWLLSKARGVRQTTNQWPRVNQNQRGVDALANNALLDLFPIMNGYDPLHLRNVRDLMSGSRGKRYYRLVKDYEPTAENQRGNLFLKRPFWLAKNWAAGPLPPKDRLFPPASVVFFDTNPDLPVPQLPLRSLSPRALSSMERAVQSLPTPSDEIAAGAARTIRLQLDLPATTGPARVANSVLQVEYESTCPSTVEMTVSDRDTPYTQPAKTYKPHSTGGRVHSIQFPLPDIPSALATMKVKAAGRSGSFRFHGATVYAEPTDEDALLRDITWRANSVRITVQEAPADRILLFTDAYYPGWHATIDGAPAPIYRANGAFKAVSIPPGTHKVEFRFRPRSVYAGLAVSIATALLLAATAVAIRTTPTKPSNCHCEEM